MHRLVMGVCSEKFIIWLLCGCPNIIREATYTNPDDIAQSLDVAPLSQVYHSKFEVYEAAASVTWHIILQ